MRDDVCGFTGHRKIPVIDYQRITTLVENQIADFASRGIYGFLCGGALGFDTIAAKSVIKMRQELGQIKLHLALPCPSQAYNWSRDNVDVYDAIKGQADSVTYVSPEYFNGCMLVRNRYLVDNSAHLVCYLTRIEGGTSFTVNYATHCGLEVINIANQM